MINIRKDYNSFENTIYFQGALDRKGIKKITQFYHLLESDTVLNLKDVPTIDSAGIGFLVKLFKYANSKGFSIRLTDVSLRVKMLLELTQIDQIFEIVENYNQYIANAA